MGHLHIFQCAQFNNLPITKIMILDEILLRSSGILIFFIIFVYKVIEL